MAFDQFDPEKMATYTEEKQANLKQDTRIVRNRLKIKAFVGNAQAYLNIRASGASFSDYLWQFVDHEPDHLTSCFRHSQCKI